MSQPASDPSPWSIEHGRVLQALDVRASDGLSVGEVKLRRERFGPNILADVSRDLLADDSLAAAAELEHSEFKGPVCAASNATCQSRESAGGLD